MKALELSKEDLVKIINKKQSEIDELVEFISIASYVLSATKLKANELIQKHTKK